MGTRHTYLVLVHLLLLVHHQRLVPFDDLSPLVGPVPVCSHACTPTAQKDASPFLLNKLWVLTYIGCPLRFVGCLAPTRFLDNTACTGSLYPALSRDLDRTERWIRHREMTLAKAAARTKGLFGAAIDVKLLREVPTLWADAERGWSRVISKHCSVDRFRLVERLLQVKDKRLESEVWRDQ